MKLKNPTYNTVAPVLHTADRQQHQQYLQHLKKHAQVHFQLEKSFSASTCPSSLILVLFQTFPQILRDFLRFSINSVSLCHAT